MKPEHPHHPLIQFFSSTRLTITLLILLGITSIAGTVIIQRNTGEASHIPHVYSPLTIRILDAVGAFDMYHSPVYLGILIALALNLTFCTLRRLPRDIAVRRRFKTEGKPDPRGIARFGFYITHAGFFTILAGGLISATLGVEGMLWLLPGESATEFVSLNDETIPLGVSIRCDAFQIDTYENEPQMVKEYRSNITLTAESGQTSSHILRVNSPISAGHFRLYQASYHIAGIEHFELNVRFKDGTKRSFPVNAGDEFRFDTPAGQAVKVRVSQFVSDFQRMDDGRVVSKSEEFNNPAAQIELSEGNGEIKKQWVFLNFPDFHGTSSSDAEYSIVFGRLQPRFGTGIQVSRDPGSHFIWLGSLALICGLILSFFLDPTKRFSNPEPGSAL